MLEFVWWLKLFGIEQLSGLEGSTNGRVLCLFAYGRVAAEDADCGFIGFVSELL